MGNYFRIYVDQETFNMLKNIKRIYEKYHPDSVGFHKSAGFLCKKAFIKYVEDDEK